MHWVFTRFFCLLGSIVSAYNERVKPQKEIERDLNIADISFEDAKQMFNPWYGGPLLTGSAHMMPPGTANAQLYVYMNDFYARWDHQRRSVNIPNKFNFNPALNGVQVGITSWLDALISIQGDVNWQNGHSHGGFGDLQAGIGIRILKEDLSIPALKLSITETFPTGKYTGLNEESLGLDAIGAGSYQMTFSLRTSKLVFWWLKHPLNFRATASYTVASSVHVKGVNAYGGGYGTEGRVHPGNNASCNFAFEYSFSQQWVFATDLVYTWSNRTRFRGVPGVYWDGTPALIGIGSSDQLSLCPAIEYNPNANLNLLAGLWFDVYGRNVSKFISGIVSIAYTVSW